MQPFLHARQIVKKFPGVLANDHVDFEANRGEIHALLGENGAGKSTLMQILYGLYEKDSGEIEIDGRKAEILSTRDAIAAGIGMIHQEFMLVRRFTVTENIVLGLKGAGRAGTLDLRGPARRIAELSERYGLQVTPDQVVGDLPVGVQQRVEILKLLYRDASMLILDEPTAVLTPQETQALFRVLRLLAEQGHAIVIVTHKLQEILDVADRVTIMRDGRVVGATRTAGATREGLARQMVGREVALRATRNARAPGPVAMAIEDLHVDDGRGRAAVDGVTLDLREGEVVGLAGVDGNGQSELAQAIMNLRPVRSGRVMMEGEDVTGASVAAHMAARIAYVPADRRHVGSVATLSVGLNAILGDQASYADRFGLLDSGRITEFARGLIDRFDVRPRDPSYAAGKLSGGNLQKVLLGRAVSGDPKVLVIEQPTRGLDVGAIEAVWTEILALRDAGKAILLISAELEEIRNLADRIAVMYEGRIMGVMPSENAPPETIGLMMAGSAPQREISHAVS